MTSAPHSQPDHEALHILIVDEEAGPRRMLRDLVVGEGFRATEVSTGQDALKILAKTPVHLVVTDLLTTESEFSGWDLLQYIKRDHPAVRVVVMTGHISRHGEAILTDRKADGYIIKPFLPRRVQALLRALLIPANLGRETEVLAVIADQELRKLTEAALGGRGLYVTIVQDARNALRYLNSDATDLIVAELRLVWGHDLDLCKTVRRSHETTFTPILLIAESASPEDITKAVKYRVNGLLIKPFAAEELARRALDLLRQAGVPQ